MEEDLVPSSLGGLAHQGAIGIHKHTHTHTHTPITHTHTHTRSAEVTASRRSSGRSVCLAGCLSWHKECMVEIRIWPGLSNKEVLKHVVKGNGARNEKRLVRGRMSEEKCKWLLDCRERKRKQKCRLLRIWKQGCLVFRMSGLCR